MCEIFPVGDLNPGPCSPHSTNIYTCKVTIMSEMGDDIIKIKKKSFLNDSIT